MKEKFRKKFTTCPPLTLKKWSAVCVLDKCLLPDFLVSEKN